VGYTRADIRMNKMLMHRPGPLSVIASNAAVGLTGASAYNSARRSHQTLRTIISRPTIR